MPSQKKKTQKKLSLQRTTTPSKQFRLKQLPQEIDIEADIFKKDITQSYPLNNVIVEQDEDMIDTFYYKDGDNKIELKKTKIASGASGTVYEIKQGPYSFTVKQFQNKEEEKKELKILEILLKTQPILCNVVNSHIITYKNKKFIVMDRYDGSLYELLEKPSISRNVSLKTNLDIFKQILHDVYCLYTNNLYYTDLKLENILYKITGKSTLKISLGDIGSICNKEIKPCGITHYPPEFVDQIYNPENIIVWNLGIMLLDVLFISKYPKGKENLYKLLLGRDSDAEHERWPIYQIRDSKTNETKFAEKKDIKEDYDSFMKQLEKDKDNLLVEQYFEHKYNGKDTIYDLIQLLLKFDHTKRISLKEVCIKLSLLEVTEQRGRFLVTREASISNSPTKSNKKTQKRTKLKKTITIREVPENSPPKPKRKTEQRGRFKIEEVSEENPPPDYGSKKNPLVPIRTEPTNRFTIREVSENSPPKPKKKTRKKNRSPLKEINV